MSIFKQNQFLEIKVFESKQHAIFQNPRTTPSRRKVKFTPKYIIVGGEGGGIRIYFKGAILFFW